MIALLQRVTQAEVRVAGETIGAIGPGVLALWGVEKGDTARGAERLVRRVLGYRIFSDENGRMNRSVTDINGGLLMVPQFTLAADTHKGTRPSFTPAATPEEGRKLFTHAVTFARGTHPEVASGEFGADMAVSLTNDGPVTFWLSVPPEPGA